MKTETGFIAKQGAAFGKEATLRPLAEILDQNALYLPTALGGDRTASLIRYMNQEWDDVTTDT